MGHLIVEELVAEKGRSSEERHRGWHFGEEHPVRSEYVELVPHPEAVKFGHEQVCSEHRVYRIGALATKGKEVWKAWVAWRILEPCVMLLLTPLGLKCAWTLSQGVGRAPL